MLNGVPNVEIAYKEAIGMAAGNFLIALKLRLLIRFVLNEL